MPVSSLPEEQIREIRWAVEEIANRQRETRLYSAYHQGLHRLMIDQVRLRTLFGHLFKNFRLNLCGAVVDALADRLQVSGFSSTIDAADQDAQDIWKLNKMDLQASEVHQAAVSASDAYVLVWPDASGEPAIYPQASHEVAVKHDDERPQRIEKAAKLWKEEDEDNPRTYRHRLNLYYPDRIEKYATPIKSAGASLQARNFEPFEVEGETWPLENTYGEVPVFHFANNAPLGKYGTSELRDAVPIQDWMNYSVFVMLVIQEEQSFPQRYAIGVEVPRDEDGKPVNPFAPGPDKMWIANRSKTDDEGNVAMGQFDAANLEQLVKVKQEISLSMAQATGTPSHYFMLPSGLVSGESQKTAEQKLDSKVTARQASFGDTWAAVMALAVKMRRGGSVDGLEFDTNWHDTKPRNETEQWAIALTKRDLGVPDDQILKELGYTDDQVKEFQQKRAEASLEPDNGTIEATKRLALSVGNLRSDGRTPPSPPERGS